MRGLVREQVGNQTLQSCKPLSKRQPWIQLQDIGNAFESSRPAFWGVAEELHLMTGEANRLSSASARGDLAKVEMLLQNGADVNANNVFGRTPLQVMKLGNPAIAEALLRANANPNVRDHVRGLTITHDAARDGYVDTLRVLIDHGADVNLLDNDGNLPLHLAAREGYLDVVQLLVGCTKDAARHNSGGHTPYDLATMNNRVSIAQYIQAHINL
ncbi:cyclin-dependent kinase 4 inhibitor C-like [Salvelinus fontinalis]|uniref:cyclin-dependent kinase 4 inhibitor C-like n=1 Tax=Salvelinus fontinalis TaxID=8038 RepID=UPI0024862C65|nr:cyclin-dependent kinase 4 inhibitor C-like [Salvelinus fontinalis]